MSFYSKKIIHLQRQIQKTQNPLESQGVLCFAVIQNPEIVMFSLKSGFCKLSIMNIRRISEGQFRLSLFSLSENFDAHYTRFLESNLGKIYSAIL